MIKIKYSYLQTAEQNQKKKNLIGLNLIALKVICFMNLITGIWSKTLKQFSAWIFLLSKETEQFHLKKSEDESSFSLIFSLE